MKRLLSLLCIIIVICTACKKTSSPNNKPPSKNADTIITDTIKKIVLNKDTINLKVGDLSHMKAVTDPVKYEDSLIWKSSDTSILTVTNSGLITAKKPGVSFILVSDIHNTKSAKCYVTVTAVQPDTSTLKEDLIAYYPFNNNADDLSGHGNDGVIHNVIPTIDRNGFPNSAYHFDHYAYIVVKDKQELRLSNTDYTLNAWIKLDAFNPIFNGYHNDYFNPTYTSAILTKRVGAQGYYFGIDSMYTPPTGVVSFSSGNSPSGLISNNLIDTGKWFFITITYELSIKQITIYINGIAVNVFAQSIEPPSATADADMYIGSDNLIDNVYYYVFGAIDDIRIYNRKLTQVEIATLYKLDH